MGRSGWDEKLGSWIIYAVQRRCGLRAESPNPTLSTARPKKLPTRLRIRPPTSVSAQALAPVWVLAPLGLAVALTCQTVGAQVAPAPDATSPKLKTSPLMQESLGPDASRFVPTFFYGDSVRGRTDLDTVIDGNAMLRKHSTVIRADRIEYYQPDDRAKASGSVRLSRAGNVFTGLLLDIKVDAFEGFLTAPSFQFLKNASHGQAERIDFLDDKRAVIKNAWLTSCRREPGPNWMPDWVLQASSIKLDTEADEGEAKSAVLRFKNTPILAVPTLGFPLSDARRSGFLPPSFTVDNISGLEITQPYYVNIAPNRDATLEPTVRLRRGFDFGGEYRYLEKDYKGTLKGSWMPNDALRGTSRWGVAAKHSGLVSLDALKAGTWGLNLEVNRVSDDNFWRDFPRGSSTLTQRLLPADFSLSRSLNTAAGPISVSARTLSWQVLQDASSPITPPYDRLPQVTANYSRLNYAGFDVQAFADTTRFVADRRLTLQPNSTRVVGQAQISRPYGAAGWSVVPKLQLHASNYSFDAPLSDGRTRSSRTLPTFSVDSGLAFERDAVINGRDFIQTLEPRAFYVRTPYRDQSALPNYDSGANDFNFATIYSENAFGGNDRIADANLLTLGATSRLLNPASGAEVARFSLAQRLRLSPQRVSLPGGAVVDERVSDLLLGAGVNTSDKFSVDTTVQYSQALRQSIRATVGARYSPAPFQVFNAAYRLQRGQSEQVDMSWQWPLTKVWPLNQTATFSPDRAGGRWYSVGRLNYSVPDRRLVDAVLGLEFDADCWVGRVVLERLQRGVSNSVSGPESSKRVLFQLEFVGFARLGNNPLAALQQNIPRYQVLREKTTSPSRFSNYE